MPHAETIAVYDEYGENYHRGVEDFWKKFPSAFVQMFLSSLPDSDLATPILNLGSGSGLDAIMLRRRLSELGIDRKIVCLDGAASMVAKTTQLGFETHHATFDQIGTVFHDRRFAGVWAHGALVHIERDEALIVLRQMRDLLLPRGPAAIGIIKKRWRMRGSGLVRHTILPKPRFFQYYTQEDLRTLVEIDCGGFRFAGEVDYSYERETFINHLYTKQ